MVYGGIYINWVVVEASEGKVREGRREVVDGLVEYPFFDDEGNEVRREVFQWLIELPGECEVEDGVGKAIQTLVKKLSKAEVSEKSGEECDGLIKLATTSEMGE